MTDHVTAQLDGIAFRLRKPHDFSFIAKYGRVTKVYDDQDSGNICFCTERGSERFFIKYAGARTMRMTGTTDDAQSRLKAALPVWQTLRHRSLARFICAEETDGGFALVFEQYDAECMGQQYPQSHEKFFSLPISARLGVFSDILSFLAHTAAMGYVAVDFYYGSVMYDFESSRTVICDIDFFRKMPTVNDMGRMWGSSRFMSPEEFTLGAPLDEVTNVYTAGAFAFALFADCIRTRESWPLGDAAYEAAAKAVRDDRSERWQSIAEFASAWDAAAKNQRTPNEIR